MAALACTAPSSGCRQPHASTSGRPTPCVQRVTHQRRPGVSLKSVTRRSNAVHAATDSAGMLCVPTLPVKCGTLGAWKPKVPCRQRGVQRHIWRLAHRGERRARGLGLPCRPVGCCSWYAPGLSCMAVLYPCSDLKSCLHSLAETGTGRHAKLSSFLNMPPALLVETGLALLPEHNGVREAARCALQGSAWSSGAGALGCVGRCCPDWRSEERLQAQSLADSGGGRGGRRAGSLPRAHPHLRRAHQALPAGPVGARLLRRPVPGCHTGTSGNPATRPVWLLRAELASGSPSATAGTRKPLSRPAVLGALCAERCRRQC